MTNDKQQTAVELFIEGLEKKGEAWKNVSYMSINISIDFSDYMELKQQAKEMQKDQHIKSWEAGLMKVDFNEYYNETYRGGEQ
jgi:hypothetical protein